ncbi:MAG: PAS domain-containing protein [Candidatus Adiutrix sp.]|jgi:PAS domain-containing protein|nr:PAS domain-containing protein [Candidatus Adiutrix sp.]
MNNLSVAGFFEKSWSWVFIQRALLKAGLGFWQLWGDGKGGLRLQVDDNLLRLTGRDRETFPVMFKDYVSLLVHPDERERASGGLPARGRSFSLEYRLRHGRTGQWRWASVFGEVAEYDAGGRPRRIFGCLQDIHDIRSAAEKKRLAKTRKAVYTEIERQKEELEKRLLSYGRLISDIQSQLDALLNAPGQPSNGVRQKAREELSDSRRAMETGGRDIGEFGAYMRRAFQLISGERVWFKAILDGLPFPVSVFDMSRRWTYLNQPAAAAMGGAGPEEFLGRRYREGWKNCRDSDLTFDPAEAGKKNFIRHVPASGRFFACQSSIIHDEAGLVIGFIETMLETAGPPDG